MMVSKCVRRASIGPRILNRGCIPNFGRTMTPAAIASQSPKYSLTSISPRTSAFSYQSAIKFAAASPSSPRHKICPPSLSLKEAIRSAALIWLLIKPFKSAFSPLHNSEKSPCSSQSFAAKASNASSALPPRQTFCSSCRVSIRVSA